MMSILGLILQVAIVFFIIRFAIGYFRRRQMQPAAAGVQGNFARHAASAGVAAAAGVWSAGFFRAGFFPAAEFCRKCRPDAASGCNRG